MKNTQLKLVHRTVAADDRKSLAMTMNMNEEQSEAKLWLLKEPGAMSCRSSSTRCLTHDPHQPLCHRYGDRPPRATFPAQARPESGVHSVPPCRVRRL